MLNILDIQRMSSEDGPGLRTTAFFKGCSLACTWCHNPESISFTTSVVWHKARCMGCFSCIETCPGNNLIAHAEGIERKQEQCAAADCLQCVAACPAGAMDAKGRIMTPEELVAELVKDRAYWGEEGGVTLSGGEALMQAESLAALRLLKEQGVKVALDTCGQVGSERLKAALAYVDTVLYDLKLANGEEHEKWTGSSNHQILANLRLVLEWAEEQKKQGATDLLWIRTPLIPQATDSADNISQLAQLLHDTEDGAEIIDRWELCAFNNLCESKYESIQQTWHFKDVPLLTKETAESLRTLALKSKVKDIRVTGATS